MATRSVNKVILIGNLGGDPELRHTANGRSVVTFNMATNEQWTKKDGQAAERTEWHRIVAWDKLAEICEQFLSKGSQVYIEGRLQTRTWEDPSGQKRRTTEIVANQMILLGQRGEPPASGGQAASEFDDFPAKGSSEDDLPF